MMLNLVLPLLYLFSPMVLGSPIGDLFSVIDNSDSPSNSPSNSPPDSPTDSPPTSPTTSKLVVAHYMVGNTNRYRVDDWETHIQRADNTGFDAFALNIGNDAWQVGQLKRAFEAAGRHENFNLFISLDMNSIPCNTQDDAGFMDAISQFFDDPQYQLYDGKPLLSTFSGQDCTFGHASVVDGWKYALSRSRRMIHFVPSFFAQDGGFPHDLAAMDGGFNWNSAWPVGRSNISFHSDSNWINDLGGRTYMAGVSPWMFAHYSSATLNKNMIYYMDEWMLTKRWEQLIEHRQQVDIVQAITWNDFGESHYIGPLLSSESQPGSEEWTTGYDHTPWLDLFAFYINAFKTGTYTISQDRIFLWARLFPAMAETPDPVGPPHNREMTQDAVWAVFLLTKRGDIQLECGDQQQIWRNVPRGISKVQIPLQSDCQLLLGERVRA
ncbi:hypothetical protein MIND_01068500 [Mycena indigotica]|uniref:Glycoside hydrolase family 71 protein n=1 Tax=Mycena indigotica TaxID=2126181 RepID=A0A8H6VVD8_9AGAR|nr:uncharacterized protein MIND_01068500 [Mycena indigotica]KAF7295292.1 hypothetical protein MIND_01068500 [Mycena indigotica]